MSETKNRKKIGARLLSEHTPEVVGSQYSARIRPTTHKEKKANFASGKNYTEESLIEALDAKRDVEKLAVLFTKLQEGKIDLQGVFQEMSPLMVKNTLMMALNGESEKNRLDAQKHMQALAGLVPVTKHAIATVDAGQSREALISQIMGTKKALKKEGIVIVEEEEKKDDGQDDPSHTDEE